MAEDTTHRLQAITPVNLCFVIIILFLKSHRGWLSQTAKIRHTVAVVFIRKL
jgi:hypothetical protein